MLFSTGSAYPAPGRSRKSLPLCANILKKAFEGRLLTDAELEATRKEPDWAPAGKLL